MTCNRQARRQWSAELSRENKRWPHDLVEVPQDQWPASTSAARIQPQRTLRSRHFLVQIFPAEPGATRITVNRTEIDRRGGWADGITWDQLQDIKRQCGYAEAQAVEIYPPTPPWCTTPTCATCGFWKHPST